MDTFGHTVKREPQELAHVKNEHEFQEFKFNQDITNLPKEESHSHVKQEHKLQKPNKKIEDSKRKQQYSSAELDIFRNSIVNNIRKQPIDGSSGLKNFVAACVLINPSDIDVPNLIHSGWKNLTEEEYAQREVWTRFNIVPELRLHLYEELGDDVKAFIPIQLEARKTFYNDIKKVVERRLKKGPKEDVLCAFAIYFRESQKDVSYNFPEMTRQEVFDTCLLRYGAMERRKQEVYEETREIEDGRICLLRSVMFPKKEDSTQPEDFKVIQSSKEELEAHIKQMPRTTEVEVVEREGGQFINVLDIKWCDDNMLGKLINCRWKDLTEEKNFQYEVTRAFGGRVIPVNDINVAWRNLGDDLRVNNLNQTRSKVAFFAYTKIKMKRALKKGVLYSFSSYYCEFEDIVKTEFPDMTKAEVYDTCLLRYIALRRGIRDTYEILSTREECRKLCNTRFGETLRV